MQWIALALLLPAPWVLFHNLGVHPSLLLQVLLPGCAILGASIMLSWAAELAEHDVPRSLALIGLALIAVLPEYAVDMYFAWMAGKDPSYIAFATANMTGANRLLIGLGWPAVVWAYWWKTRKPGVALEKSQSLEIFVLLVVTLYCFLIPIKGSLGLEDTVVLVSCFIFYVYAASRHPHEEPDIEEGPAATLGRLATPLRRACMAGFFLISGYAIFISAEPFAEGLLALGRGWGIEQFLLVQWLAPLASESPEFIVALVFALRNKPQVGMGALVSSKVNQWTLLIGMLPIAYSLSLGHPASMHLDGRQVEEILLTAAQSLFGLAVLVNFDFSLKESFLMAGLFVSQAFFPSTHVRYAFSAGYLLLSLGVVLSSPQRRHALKELVGRVLKDLNP